MTDNVIRLPIHPKLRPVEDSHWYETAMRQAWHRALADTAAGLRADDRPCDLSYPMGEGRSGSMQVSSNGHPYRDPRSKAGIIPTSPKDAWAAKLLGYRFDPAG